MDLIAAIHGRRAVRAYAPDPVDAAVLRDLVAAAVQAPSAMNRQPWRFTIVTDRALLARLSDAAKAHLLGAGALGPRYASLDAMLRDPAAHIFHHAPALVVIAAEAAPFAVEDCALAAQNLMLAAHAAGLGSCWIGLAQSWLATAAGKAALGLGADELPVAPIIVGHPAEQRAPVPRRPPQIRWLA